MTALDDLRKLDEQREKLLKKAKDEALQNAKKAVADLNALGFNYKLVQGSGPERTGTRRTGIRQEVLNVVKRTRGLKRADILATLDAKDKSAQQSVSNALSALKKSGAIKQNEEGAYVAA